MGEAVAPPNESGRDILEDEKILDRFRTCAISQLTSGLDPFKKELATTQKNYHLAVAKLVNCPADKNLIKEINALSENINHLEKLIPLIEKIITDRIAKSQKAKAIMSQP